MILNRRHELDLKSKEFLFFTEQRDREILQLRNMLNEKRLNIQEPVVVTQGTDVNAIKGLQNELEEAREEIDKLKRDKVLNQMAPPQRDPADQEEIDRLRKEIENSRQALHKAIREKKIEYVEKIVEVEKELPPQTPPYVFVEKALAFAEKNFEERLVPYLYTIWKLLFHIRTLNAEYKKMRADEWKKKNMEPLVVTEQAPPTAEMARLISIKIILS